MRRQVQEIPGAPSQQEEMVSFGEFSLNLATREMYHNEESIALTSGEFAVLKVLVTHPREPLSRDKLMNLARGRDYSALERSIDVQVSRLRRLIEKDPANRAISKRFGAWGTCLCQMVPPVNEAALVATPVAQECLQPNGHADRLSAADQSAGLLFDCDGLFH